MFISRTPLSTIEDTYVQQVLSPMLQSIFNSDERLEIEWSNAVLPSSGTKVYKPDFAVFSHIINKKCLLLVSEFKPTKQNSAIESDLVKLGHQMRSTYNALVRNRVDQPFVCGVRSEGTRLTTYVMDMPSPHLYRMTKLSELSLFENVEQLSVLPNIVMKLTQLKSITVETLDKAESAILHAAKTNHRGPAFPPISWLSGDTYMLQRKPKSTASVKAKK